MAYIGKFVDRNPCIRTAGTTSSLGGSVAEALKFYSLEEMAEEIMRTKCNQMKKAERQNTYPRWPYIPMTTVDDVLSTELKKSRFVAFREKFSEDMYFKKPELGKVYPVHSKPDEITNENRTFGVVTTRSEGLYDFLLPKRTRTEVDREYTDSHEKYIVSHNHYFPSEQKNRHYDRKSFDPKATFGINTKVDINGKNVRRCLTECDRMVLVTSAQKQFIERSMGRLGKQVVKHNYKIPPNMTFGAPTIMDECNVQALIEHISPCVRKSKLTDAIAHINRMRQKIFNRSDLHMYDIKLALRHRDTENTGTLPLPKIFSTMREMLLRMDEDKIMTALKHFNLITDDTCKTQEVNYSDFVRLLQIQIPLPKTGNISTMPEKLYNKDTTYRLFCNDRHKEPIGGHQEVRRDEMNAKNIVTPDIPMTYGLVGSDFNKPLPKEAIRRIFNSVLPDNFEEVWQRAIVQFKRCNDLLTVNQMREAMATKPPTPD